MFARVFVRVFVRAFARVFVRAFVRVFVIQSEKLAWQGPGSNNYRKKELWVQGAAISTQLVDLLR